MSHSEHYDPKAGIAIVGMAGRFPGAATVAELWRNLRAGVESVRFFGDDELRAAGVPEASLRDPSYVKAYGWLDDVELFDAAFFDVPPREAELLDPQHRHLLECAWAALEDAGYDPARSGGSVGIYAGAGRNHYYFDHLVPERKLIDALGGVAAMIANEKDFVATRVAYKLDLGGPCVTVQSVPQSVRHVRSISTSAPSTRIWCGWLQNSSAGPMQPMPTSPPP